MNEADSATALSIYLFKALLIQVGPKECLARGQDLIINGGNLKLVLERSNILVTECKSGMY